jgi:hypothetical protein
LDGACGILLWWKTVRDAPEGSTGVISVVRAPAVWRDRLVPYVVDVDGLQLAALMPKEEAHLSVSAGEHEVLARVSFCSSPTESVNVESGGVRHLLVRLSPVPFFISAMWLRSSYVHWIDAKTARPLTGSARLNPWYLRSVLLWAMLLVGFFFQTSVQPHILVAGLFPGWFVLGTLAIALAVSSIRGLRRNQI